MPRARIMYFYGNISGMATDIEVFRRVFERFNSSSGSSVATREDVDNDNSWQVDVGYFDDDPNTYPVVDVQISLEQIYAAFLPRARINVFMINQEIGHDTAKYALVDVILCKTHYAAALVQRRCKQLGITPSPRIVETRFCSKDVMASMHMFNVETQGAWSATPATAGFLHVAGKSRCKQTRAVLDAWSQHQEWPPLHVVCNPAFIRRDILPYLNDGGDNNNMIPKKNIIMHTRRLSERALRTLQMTTPFHICPSEAEGWGHAINEGRSCAAVVVTTHGPPMNELAQDHVSGILVHPVKSVRYRQRRLWMSLLPGSVFLVSPKTVADAVERCLALTIDQRRALGLAARYQYEADRCAFESCMETLITQWCCLSSAAPPRGHPAATAINYVRANVRQVQDIVPRNLIRSIVSAVLLVTIAAAVSRIMLGRRTLQQSGM